MKIFKKLIFIIVSFAGLLVYGAYNQPSQLSLTNGSLSIDPSFAFSPIATPLPHGSQAPQMARSLLGLEVKFLNGHVDYPGLTITADQRYQALTGSEKLVDAIKFQPLGGSPFLLLIAIAKKSGGDPLIVPGKFDIVRKTEQEGFVLKDSQGRLFYYGGYILMTPAWKGLTPGQILQDKFCKEAVPMAVCPSKNTVNVILKKPADALRDIPFLAFVQ